MLCRFRKRCAVNVFDVHFACKGRYSLAGTMISTPPTMWVPPGVELKRDPLAAATFGWLLSFQALIGRPSYTARSNTMRFTFRAFCRRLVKLSKMYADWMRMSRRFLRTLSFLTSKNTA